ncbi:MAG: hypothetical protein ACOZNI_29815 [Myxococcota bacterium]
MLVLLAACDGGGPGKADDTGGAPGCGIRLEETFPEDGATDAYVRGPVEFKLTDPDLTASIEVPGVAGTTSVRGTAGQIVVFTPDAPLEPLTSHEATLTWCGGTSTIAFTTSEAGLPLADPAALEGVVFAIPFESGRVVEPDGAAGVLGQYLTQTDLLRVDAVGDTLSVTNALAIEGASPPAQDWCVPTTRFAEADFGDAPFFSLAADAVTVVLAGYVVELLEVEVTGAFSPDGGGIAGGALAYVMDTRPLAPLVDADDPGSVCKAAVEFAEECEPCPDTGEPWCLRFRLDQLEGAAIEGLALADVPGVDCAGCETAPPPDDAVCE